jgi:hypothetical protein
MTQRRGQAVWELAMGWKNRDLLCGMMAKCVYYFRYFLPTFRPSVHFSTNVNTVSTAGIYVIFDIDDYCENMSGYSRFG